MGVVKRCGAPGCRELVALYETYCPSHKAYSDKQYNKQVRHNKVNKPRAVFYASKEWRSMRHQVLVSQHYLCQSCKRKGIVKQGNIVHHIIPLEDDWNKRLDKDNLEVICQTCHNKEDSSKSKLFNNKN